VWVLVVPAGGTLGGAYECGVGRGDGATEAGDAKGNGPTLLLLFEVAVPEPDPRSAACIRWYVGNVGVGAGVLVPFIIVDVLVLYPTTKENDRHEKEKNKTIRNRFNQQNRNHHRTRYYFNVRPKASSNIITITFGMFSVPPSK